METQYKELELKIKQTLEKQTCAACNHRKASVRVTIINRKLQLHVYACCFNFEKELRKMADEMWVEFNTSIR